MSTPSGNAWATGTPVRKAADTEFILRYRALVQAEEPLEVSEAPLTLSLVSNSNLSIDDFRLGYRSPDRVAYRDAYEHWHREIHSGRHSGHLPFPHTQRAFPAPLRFLPNAQQRLELDTLIVGDFGDESDASRLMLDHLASAREHGLRIGLMHFPSLLHAEAIDKSFSAELLDAFAAGLLHRVEVTDRVSSKIVNIYDPTAFQYRRELLGNHVAGQVSVWAGEPPYRDGTDEHQYDVGAVERNAMAVFRAWVRWNATDPSIATVISKSRNAWPSTEESHDALGTTETDDLESSLELASSNVAPSN